MKDSWLYFDSVVYHTYLNFI